MGVNNEKKEVEKYFYLEKKKGSEFHFPTHFQHTFIWEKKKKEHFQHTFIWEKKKRNTSNTRLFGRKKKKEHFQHTFIWEKKKRNTSNTRLFGRKKKKKEVEKLSS